jgi:hypothetical protein
MDRWHTGTPFMMADAYSGAHGAQLAHLARFLQWLSPLNSISKEDQRTLGLLGTIPAWNSRSDPAL